MSVSNIRAPAGRPGAAGPAGSGRFLEWPEEGQWERWHTPSGLGSGPQSRRKRPERAPARRRRTGAQRRTSWNVLAEELVSFPPPSTRRSLAQVPGETGPSRAAFPARTAASGPSKGRRAAAVVQLEQASSPSAVRTGAPAPSLGPAGSRRPAPRPRGWRRLLPGAATLAILVSVWFCAGGLAGLHRRLLDCSGFGCEGARGLPVRCSSRRHLVVDRLRASARRRPEASRGQLRAAAPRCRAGPRRRAQVALRARARRKRRIGATVKSCAARGAGRPKTGSWTLARWNKVRPYAGAGSAFPARDGSRPWSG